MDELTLAIALAPRDASLYLARAQTLIKLKKWPEALADLDRCVSKQGDPAWWITRGHALAGAERPREVVTTMTSAIRRFPKVVGLMQLRWRAHAALGQDEAANRDCQVAAQLDPDPDDVAACAERLPPADASALLFGALQRRPSELLRERLVDLELRRGNIDRALLLVDGQGDRLTWRVRRGEILANAGRSGAKDELTATLRAVRRRLVKRESDLLRLLEARTLTALGHRAQAIAVLQSIVVRRPQLLEARDRLERLTGQPGSNGPQRP